MERLVGIAAAEKNTNRKLAGGRAARTPFFARYPGLRVVGIHSEVSEQQRFAARLIASAVRLYGHEYSVNLR